MVRKLHLLKIKVEYEAGHSKVKRIQFDGFDQPVRMGVHTGFSEFWGIVPEEPLPSTLDYLVAAIGGCMTGTLAAALRGRGIESGPDKLTAEVEGQLEEVQGTLLLTKVSILYKLKVPKDKRPTADRALQHHHSACPVSASVKKGIDIEWRSEIVEE